MVVQIRRGWSVRWLILMVCALCVPGAMLLGAPKAVKPAAAKPAKPAKTSPTDDLLPGLDDDVKSTPQGDFSITLVTPDGKPIEPNRYVRGVPGRWAVSEFPHVFALDGQSLFTAGTTLDAKVPAAGSVAVFCKAATEGDEGPSYSARCTARIPAGNYSIAPFNLKFEVSGAITPRHPAITAVGKALSIRTAPVSFSVLSTRGGAALPLNNFQLFQGSTNLLENLVDAKGALSFSALTMYLPVGLDYRSSLGGFSIDNDGKVVPENLDKSVKVEGNTLVSRVEPKSGQVVQEPVGKGYWLLSHNLRRVFKRGETGRFDVIVSGQFPAAELAVSAKSQAGTHELGKIALPAVDSGTDSRLFLLDTGRLAPGKYELTLGHANAHPFGFEVVELLPTSPLLLLTINACGESDFTLDSAGMAQMRDTGVKMWMSYGHASVLGRLDMLGLSGNKPPYPAAPADAPAELRRGLDAPRTLLDDSLRHGLITMDYENRRAGWYNEGLAFHHTHPMSVERMVRRVQIFGQELEDFPAFAGMSYTWFPALAGYVEGGVACDPFFGTRMEILRANVKRETGFEPLARAEQEKLRKGGLSAEEKRALADKERNYWRAEQRMGWLDTFTLYNRKLREVRPDFMATTSENAGHDSGKSLPDIAGAHDAMSHESYTDFGDWPMSAGFVVDWAHGQIGGKKPVWQSVDPSNSLPAQVIKQFYKFARGAEGIANGVHPPSGARINARRALSNKFLERYGSLVTDWSADTQVAVCVSDVQFGEYDAHALHGHLTRLGYGPIIVSERTLESTGVPAGIKAVFVPNLKMPFGEKAEKGLKSFMAAGGKVVLVGEKCEPIEGAITVQVDLKTLWDVGGFAAHVPFFSEFKHVRPALEKVLGEIGLSPRNGAAPEQAVILPLTAGGVRYVTVLSSPLEFKDTTFNAVTGINVKVGQAKRVINLVTGADLPAKDGAVSVDLVSEPVAFLALLDDQPQSIVLHHPARATAGDTLELFAEAPFGPSPSGARAPVEYTIADAAGAVRARFYRLAGDKSAVSYRIPNTDPAGDYTLTATELLTGVTAKAKVAVAASGAIAAVAPADPVYIPHPHRVPLFMKREQPVRVIVEDAQADLLPQAQRLVDALTKAGRSASLQRVSDASFDMYWLKWISTPANEKLLAKVDAGEIVGYRGDLKVYINTAKREHVPEKGGWEDISPKYVIRTDVVLFSGGRIADSLNVISDWTQTPNFPGKGQGAIEVSLSPFWADRDAVTVVASDDAGRARAVDRLIELIDSPAKAQAPSPFAAPQTAAASASTAGTDRTPIETPLKGFVPPALSESLAAAPDGSAAVGIKGATAVVSAKGEVRVLPRFDIPPTVFNGGRLLGATVENTVFNPAWHFPTGWKVTARRVDGAGHLDQFEVPQSYVAAGDKVDGWDKGFAVSSDGNTYFAARDGGGYFIFDLAAKSYRKFEAPAPEMSFYEEARVPVTLTAAAMSPDNALVAYTVGNHPTGYGGMMGPPPSAFATSLHVIDLKTGAEVWSAHTEKQSDASLSAYGGALAVSEGGKRIAFIDWDQNAVLYDGAGKRIAATQLFDWKKNYDYRTNPKPLRCDLSRDGSVALFVSDGNVLVTDAAGKPRATFNVTGLSDVRMTPDGATIYTADQDGLVTAFDNAGQKRWSLQTSGERPHIAVTDAGLLVAEGSGNLLSVDAKGAVTRTVPFVAPPPATPAQFETLALQGPATYREPQTLATLQRLAQAKPLKALELQGTPREAFGKRFFPVTAPITLDVPVSAGQQLVHLVYRHAGKPASITLTGGPAPLTFVLDLPTPEYRVVDLPCDARQSLTVTLPATAGLEIAELSVHAFTLPGANGLYVKPAGTDPSDGLAVREKPAKNTGDDLILDDKDPSSVAKSAAGKMKNAGIFAANSDPDQVEGHYIRATGNVLEAFDGQRFLAGKPAAWTKSKNGPFGTRLIVDLNHLAKPKICVTFDRTLKQSEVTQGLAILRGKKSDLVIGPENAGPDHIGSERRVIAGIFGNDQFFNAFDTRSVEMEALGVYVCARDGIDLGLSEVELYE